jgi:L-malate glycosyltransferase
MLEHRDDIPALMAASDVLVSCSENEPFGRVLAEAGAAGLPVVSTRSGGKSEIVEEFVTGMLAAQNDNAELLQQTLKVLSDAKLRDQMGQMARMRIERLYDVRRTAQELSALFEQLVAERRAQAHV